MDFESETSHHQLFRGDEQEKITEILTVTKQNPIGDLSSSAVPGSKDISSGNMKFSSDNFSRISPL